MKDSRKAMDTQQLIDWLLEGDVAIQYQVQRDLLATERPDLRERIATEGWGAKFLSFRKPEGHWGQRFYQPKWISTHYTLLDLKHLAISPDHADIRESIAQVLRTLKAPDGGILPIGPERKSDVCVNGMFLNYAAYFGAEEETLQSIIDLLLAERMPDGGFNCDSNRQGAVHGSLHSTISVLEGILAYERSGYTYRLAELQEAAEQGREFLLQHRLFRSDRTGQIIDKRMLMLSYPSRWRYDILRALDYFQVAGIPYDPRMQDALDVLMKKRRKDNRWPVQAKHPGQTHFDMEKTGGPSRWNTLRALRVLRHFGGSDATGTQAGVES
ncbi:MAG: hypothetical protein PVI09_19200 [Anaerolineae bacterium]|jgi:hypothetical protein